MSQNILKYESKVWATADLLIGAGIKQSDFPKYMMPFFALIMVESRFVRMADDLKKELEESGDNLGLEDFIEEIKDQEKGYNTYLFEHDKTLADICKNDKTFDRDFDAYLLGFDAETKDLLGVNKGNEEEEEIGKLIEEFQEKIEIFFDYIKTHKDFKELKAKMFGTQFGEDEVYNDFRKLYNSFVRRKKKDIGEFFIKETKDLVEKLCDDFEEMVRKEGI